MPISSGYRGGKEEAPQAYYKYVEEADDDANKGSRMKAAWLTSLHAHSGISSTGRHTGHSTTGTLLFGLIGDHALSGKQ